MTASCAGKPTMTFDEYQQAALRTAAGDRIGNVEMCIRALGLCGEIGELREAFMSGSEDDRVKELGDVLWYAATLADMFKISQANLVDHFFNYGYEPNVIPPTIDYVTFHLDEAQKAINKIAEMVKKQVGHNKPADYLKLVEAFDDLFVALLEVGPCSLGEAAYLNVEKLKKRYPAGFDMAIASAKPDSAPSMIAPRRALQVDGLGRTVEDTGFNPNE